MNTLTQQQINQYQWQVADGVAKPVNPFKKLKSMDLAPEDKGNINPKWKKHEIFWAQNFFASNAPDGIYSGEAFELVWQIMDIDEEHAKWDDISQHDMKCYGFDYQKLVSEYEFKDTVHTRLFLSLKPSHLPSVLTTQPGDEWKDRYSEVWYFYDFDLLKWKDLKPRLQNDVIFEEAINMYRKVKREWHLITPPAEQEAETVEQICKKALQNIDLNKFSCYEALQMGYTLCLNYNGEKWQKLQSTLTQKDQRIAELEREREWVSVEDRLPEGQTEVLVYMPKYGSDMNVYFLTDLDPERKTWFNCFFDTKPFSDVTHWMPLPTPPQH